MRTLFPFGSTSQNRIHEECQIAYQLGYMDQWALQNPNQASWEEGACPSFEPDLIDKAVDRRCL